MIGLGVYNGLDYENWVSIFPLLMLHLQAAIETQDSKRVGVH